jgi:hypothetical protein
MKQQTDVQRARNEPFLSLVTLALGLIAAALIFVGLLLGIDISRGWPLLGITSAMICLASSRLLAQRLPLTSRILGALAFPLVIVGSAGVIANLIT